MTIVTAQMSVSVDGCYAGPMHTDMQTWLDGPEAAGFFRVTRWAIDAEAWRQRLGFKGGEQNTNSEVIAETFDSAGAYVMGRRMADGGEIPWGEDPPFRAPGFVVTNRPRQTLHRHGGTSFTYITAGIHSAIEQARAAANGKDVAIAGGGILLRQVIKLGLLDELDLHAELAHAAGLSSLFPELGATGAGPADDRLSMFDAVVGVLSQLAGGGGLVVVLEDLQWADEPTLRALVHVARARPPVGLLVVATYRDTELIGRDALTAALGELSLQSDVTRLRLAGLDAGEVAALVAAIGPDNLPRLAEIDRRSGGNPFFVMALAELATSSASPSAVRDVVRGRMRRLTPGAQPIVAAAATLGEDLDPLVVSAAVEQPVDRVLAAFDEAQDAGITREVVTNLPHLTGGGTGGENALPGNSVFYLIFLALAVIAVAVVAVMYRSRFGYALRAINQDEDAAGAAGINTTRAKVAAFGLSGLLNGLVGATYAFQQVTIFPQRLFDVDISVLIIVMVVIGGSGTVLGPVLGAVGLQYLSEYLRQNYTNFHSFILGGIIIITVVLVPQGATSFAPDAWRARRVPFLDTIRSYRL